MRLAVLLILAAPGWAQVFGVSQLGAPDGEVTLVFTADAAKLAEPAVKDQAYSADRVTKLYGSEIVQTVYRDSEGRTRTEGIGGRMLAEIVDPVSRFAYVVDDVHRVTHRVAMPAVESMPLIRRGGQGSGVSGGMASSAIGGSNGAVIKLINVSHKEPPASLFQVPKDYKMVLESGPFRITFAK